MLGSYAAFNEQLANKSWKTNSYAEKLSRKKYRWNDRNSRSWRLYNSDRFFPSLRLPDLLSCRRYTNIPPPSLQKQADYPHLKKPPMVSILALLQSDGLVRRWMEKQTKSPGCHQKLRNISCRCISDHNEEDWRGIMVLITPNQTRVRRTEEQRLQNCGDQWNMNHCSAVWLKCSLILTEIINYVQQGEIKQWLRTTTEKKAHTFKSLQEALFDTIVGSCMKETFSVKADILQEELFNVSDQLTYDKSN